MHKAMAMLAALLIAASTAQPAEARGFRPKAEKSRVAMCSIVYPILRTKAAALIDPLERTQLVLAAHRGEGRIAPYVDAVVKAIGAEAFKEEQYGHKLLVGVIASSDVGDPRVAPEILQARELHATALWCENHMDRWGAPAFTGVPEGMVPGPDGPVAEYRVGGRSVGDHFADPREAALASAACEGDTATVARQLAAGANPNAIGYEGITPLLWTVRCESLPGLEALLTGGGDPNLTSSAGFSPVFAAATMRNSAILKLLLSRGGDPNAADADGESALVQAMKLAVLTGDASNFRALVESGADINRVYDSGGTIATEAALLSQFDLILYLLERGYSHGLKDLGFYIQRLPDDPELTPGFELKRAKVVEALKARGVTFPVSSEDSGFASDADSPD